MSTRSAIVIGVGLPAKPYLDPLPEARLVELTELVLGCGGIVSPPSFGQSGEATAHLAPRPG